MNLNLPKDCTWMRNGEDNSAYSFKRLYVIYASRTSRIVWIWSFVAKEMNSVCVKLQDFLTSIGRKEWKQKRDEAQKNLHKSVLRYWRIQGRPPPNHSDWTARMHALHEE